MATEAKTKKTAKKTVAKKKVAKKKAEPKKAEKPVEVKKQYLVINADKLDGLDDLVEILTGYPGEIFVYIKRGGKTYKLNQQIRNCRGLISELESILGEEDIIFIEK